MLETLNYEVVGEAQDGAQAVELAKNLNPEICLLDVKMPVMDGIDAATAIAEEGIAPVVLITAYSDQELVERASSAGVFGYIVKPFKPSDLGPSIEVARSRFDQNTQLTKEITTLSERLEARKSVEKAKGVLMQAHGLNESEAYRRIQQQSMNARKSMKEVADAIILAQGV